LKETKHLHHGHQKQVAKIVHCGEHLYFNKINEEAICEVGIEKAKASRKHCVPIPTVHLGPSRLLTEMGVEMLQGTSLSDTVTTTIQLELQ